MTVPRPGAAPWSDPSRLPALPEEAPLAMPVQTLWRRPPPAPRPETAPSAVGLRRALMMGLTVLMTLAAAQEMYRVLEIGGLTLLEGLVLIFFVLLFAWIALAFVSACAGFAALVAGGGLRPGIEPRAPLPAISTRTALLLPVYNEDPARIAAGLQAIQESLVETGQEGHFDLFILSDSTDPDLWIAEEAAFLALRQRLGPAGARVFYRHRRPNSERKAGNIADWVRRFGGRYPFMLILDADSLMTGEAIVRLVAAMERHPRVGLIQTFPMIVGATTLFARLQQFASRVYGLLIAQGIAWWHGAEENYWGHNAIIRTQAFAEQAGLPQLKGRKPFGGHILSHDFVEAALIRRGGWAVHMVPGLAGSYEESPPSLVELAARDRRWCQGNLQHAALLPARGLHWISRLHFLSGIGTYITAPLWLLFLLTGALIALQARFVPTDYFPTEFTLFPVWPQQDPVRAMWVFAATMGIVLAPKLLAYLALLLDGAARRGCGGALTAFASLLLETLLAGLLAPVTMLSQSAAVCAILTGRDAGWQPQRRDDGSIPAGEVVRRYTPHTLFGLALGAGAYAVSPPLLAWMSPVVAGLALAIPLVLLTAGRGPGQLLRRAGLLLTPEEAEPPPVLARARALYRTLQEEAAPRPALRRLAEHPALFTLHRGTVAPPAPRRRPVDVPLVVGLAKLAEAGSLDEAAADLDRAETAAVLSDPRGLERVARLGGGSAEGASA